MFEPEEYEGGGDEQVDDIEEDIYGDLETDIFLAQTKRPKLDDIFNNEEFQKLKNENHALKVRLKQLLQENQTYARNISSLYLTAKNEIDKKNFIIKNLTEKLKTVTKSKSSLSDSDAQEILRQCQDSFLESQRQVTLNEINECMKRSASKDSGRKKVVKFGNMSFYCFREDGSFKREEEVKFPTKPKASSNISEIPQAQTNTSSPSAIPPEIERLKAAGAVVEAHTPPPQLSETTPAHALPSPAPDSDAGKSLKRKRDGEKDPVKRDSDRGRDQPPRRHSGDRYSHNPHKTSRTRDYSPSSNDRYQTRKSESDRFYNTRQKDNTRRADNYDRDSYHNRNARGSKHHPPRRCHYEKSYRESTERSRSRSK